LIVDRTLAHASAALLFDIDGTLFHGHGAGRRAFLAAISEHLGRPADDRGFSFAGRTDGEILRVVLERNEAPSLTREERARIFRGYLERLDSELDAGPPPREIPGAVALIERLSADSRFAVGLLTGNLRAGAETKLRRIGLWGPFHFGAFGDDHEDRDCLVPIGLARLVERGGPEIAPARAVVIGDTVRDIACARAGGARVLAVGTSVAERDALRAAGPDAYADDLADAESIHRTLLWLAGLTPR